MLRKLLFALLLTVVLAPLAHAQSVDEILGHYYKAAGTDKLRKVQSMKLSGHMELAPGAEAPFTMEKKRPGKQRLEFTFQGMTGVQAYDGTTAWQVMPFMGKKDPEPMTADDRKETADNSDFDGPLVDWKAKGHVVELVGRDSVDGVPAYKLKLTKKGGAVEYHWLDAETWLPVKEEASRVMNGTTMATESIIGDYKDVSGVMIPFSLTNGVKGSDRKQKLLFDKAELDVAIDDSRFAMPAATMTAPPAVQDSSKAAPAK